MLSPALIANPHSRNIVLVDFIELRWELNPTVSPLASEIGDGIHSEGRQFCQPSKWVTALALPHSTC
jgi:hypothetical protein